MPDPKKKLVQVNGVGVVEFPHDMEDHHIGAAIRNHLNPFDSLPPELQRIQHAVGAEVVPGKPYGDAIASVGAHEPHKIEINDPERFKLGESQTLSHEVMHLLQNQLPGPLIKAIPPDNPKAPYDLSNIDQLRAQGRTLVSLPHEQAAALVQLYVADPSQRNRLQPWIDDLNKTPLSVMNPTDPNQKGINTTVRPPTPPIQAYITPQQVKEQAEKLNPQLASHKNNQLPPQPKEALNQYPNPEDRPPKESFAFNKAWSKPGPYAAKLTPQEETEFRKWAAANPQSVRGEVGPAPNFDSLPMADYDVRAHFHAAKIGDPAATLVPNKWDGKIHGNDKFKTPYNGGFSNESMYALPNAPRWVGNRLMTADGKLVTDETPRKAAR
jgi:hypothetical protein